MKRALPILLLLGCMSCTFERKAVPIQEHGVFATAVPVYKEAGRYTPEALDAKIRGTVEVAVMVGKDGLPTRVRIVQGLGYGLDASALAAVRQWRFKPSLVEAQPTESEIVVGVPFDPSVNPRSQSGSRKVDVFGKGQVPGR